MTDFTPTEPKLGDDGLPIPNLPLLRKVLDQIDAHPETYHQMVYRMERECGTTYCIAGWTAQLSGYDFDPADCTAVIGPDGVSRPVAGVAQELLGITMDDAWLGGGLFALGSTRGQVQTRAEAIAARAGERL